MRTSDALKLFLWEVLNPAVLKWKRRQTYSDLNGVVGLNLGCGLDCPPNWLGIDGGPTHFLASTLPRRFAKALFRGQNMARNYDFDEYRARLKAMRFVHHDLAHGIPVPDASVDNVFSSHFFEHIDRRSALALLGECLRVLKPGGLLRICVPSLDHELDKMRKAIAAYDAGDGAAVQQFVTSKTVGYLGPYSHHRHMYNEASLSALIAEAGFADVRVCSRGEGLMQDVAVLDTRPGIYVEARKP